jgi:hypothetical protein
MSLTTALGGTCALAMLLCVPAAAQTPQAQTTSVRISGTVRSADNGMPVVGATVEFTFRGGDWTSIIDSEITDTSGRYEFNYTQEPYMQDPEYFVEASLDGFVKQSWGESSTSGAVGLKAPRDARNIDFQLMRTGAISGDVLDQAGYPVAGLEIRAVEAFYYVDGRIESQPDRFAKTDSNGHYRLDQLRPGPYFVQTKRTPIEPLYQFAYAISFYPRAEKLSDAEKIDVGAGAEINGIHLQVARVPTHTISVTLLNANASPPNSYKAGIQADTGFEDYPGLSSSEKISESGNPVFTFSHAAPGDFKIYISAGGGPASAYKKVTVGDGDVAFEIDVNSAPTVRGRVQLAEDLNAIPGAGVGISLVPEKASRIASPSSARIDPNGEFEFLNVPPGIYFFNAHSKFVTGLEKTVPPSPAYLESVTCGGTDFTFKPLTLAEGEIISDCQIVMRHDGGQVSGVIDAGGLTVLHWRIYIVPVDPALRRFRLLIQKAEADGKFRESMIPPGDYVVYAVPQKVGDGYFSVPDFFEKNANSATHITVPPNQALRVTLKPIL